MERSQPRGVKSKMRGRKLTNSVNWYGALKQRGVTQTGVKQVLSVYMLSSLELHLHSFLTSALDGSKW
jgi:hypothetical protein